MINIDGSTLTINDLAKVAYEKEKVSISELGKERIIGSSEKLLKIIESGKPIYGVNTGFGIFANKIISEKDNEKLNRNLIISHAVGTGNPLHSEIIRAAMLIRANALTKGYSGVRLEIVQVLLDMLNKDVVPVINSKGSLGSSGDLCMLAQMALVLSIGEKENENESGIAVFNGNYITGSKAMQMAGVDRLRLSQKEGLALINGATFSAAVMALCIEKAEFLCNLADLTISLSLEALVGRSEPFHPDLHQARGLAGQIKSAEKISRNIAGSTLVNSHSHVQDAYSLRCSPQVHGAVRDTLEFVKRIIDSEINAATDNPLIVAEDKVISGGNFHGEPVGMCADFLSIALAELGAISERRVFRLMDKNLNFGLKEMFVDSGSVDGLNSGLMMLQYTAAALVLENQTLSSPDSVRSLPTSANQEDHNANAFTAAIHTWQIIDNLTRILAIELFSSNRAIEQRMRAQSDQKLGSITAKAFNLIKDQFPYKADDSLWRLDMEKLYSSLLSPSDFKKSCGPFLIDKMNIPEYSKNMFDKKDLISRRNFLQKSLIGMSGLILLPKLDHKYLMLDQWPEGELLGRNTVYQPSALPIRTKPAVESSIVRHLQEDEVVVWLREVLGESPVGRPNKTWVETPEGYIYAPSLQKVKNFPNTPVTTLPTTNGETGMWVEVTVPYVNMEIANPPTRAPWLNEVSPTRWRLYYSQVIWIDEIKTESDGRVLYRLNERYGSYGDIFWADAAAFRIITAEEIAPINPEAANKNVLVNINQQSLTCFEGDNEVYFCRVATGRKLDEFGTPVDTWATPTGEHWIWRKLMSIHMSGGGTGAGWDTMSVPWTSLFVGEGVAIHSTFWHNDFGTPKSHGCVNALPEDSKWIFRWSTPQVFYNPGDITTTTYEGTKIKVVEPLY